MEVQTAVMPDLRILVVDDEPFVRAITVHVLQQLGFQQIETACDGEDALSVMQASARPFELVICDLNMPVMDGFDFIHAAQRINYKGALILLSSEAPEKLQDAVELGIACDMKVIGALSKPLEREALQDMLMKYYALPA